MPENITVREYSTEFTAVIGSVLILENICGLLFNVIVLFVYHKSKWRKTSKKQTNNVLISNLNVVDTVVCLTAVPLTFYMVVRPQGQTSVTCLLHEATVAFASSACAINLLVITYDRYEAIIRPFSRKINEKNITCAIVFTWLVSIVGFFSPFAALALSKSYKKYEGSIIRTFPCVVWVESAVNTKIYFEVYYCLLYVLANTVMVICYFRIFKTAVHSRMTVRLALVRASLPGLRAAAAGDLEDITDSNTHSRDPDHNVGNNLQPEHQPHTESKKPNEKSVTRATMMIVSTFMVCWAPHTVTSLVIMVAGSSHGLDMVQFCCLTLAYLSCTLHPLLYVVMRKAFRDNLRHSLRRALQGHQVHPAPNQPVFVI